MSLDLRNVLSLIRLALEEDLGSGDVTSEALVPETAAASGAFRPRREGVVAGLPVAEAVYRELSPAVRFESVVEDGATLDAGAVVARVAGPARAVLAGERLALNFLQRMSGVATLTRRCVEAVRGTPCVIQDTRKTLPGWRLLDKYAVRVGGGVNHRMGLYDQVLLKDNHLRLAAASAPEGVGGLAHAVRLARERVGDRLEIEVECETRDQVAEALGAGADIIMLDNMPDALMRECAALVREAREARRADRPVTEASGGLTPDRLPAVAATGVDRISLGYLTHSAPALDIGLDFD